MIALTAFLVFCLTFEKRAYTLLLARPERQTGVLAISVILACLWQIKAGILPELNIHILGITAATLVLGFRLSMLTSTIALLITLLTQNYTIDSFGNAWMFSVILPVFFSYGLYLLIYRFLLHHFFVYIFVGAFIAGGMTAAFRIISSSLYFFYTGVYDWQTLSDNYLYFSVIMWFPEAMLNGMAITLLITYRPHWVKTFYDKEYLNK
ncbi:energy-coupling factor ABC transporter permease [Pseudoalteromonas xiamenensis]|uniref:energy-coupling factor ABC transporter permease n=1 Tax=Pseudoalteromonas xiamenensis TaxID=882626 RepID=UPI0035EB8BD6